MCSRSKMLWQSAIVIVIVYTVIQISNGNICNTTITMSPSGDVNVLVGNTAVVYGLVNNSCGSNSFTPSCSINNISVINLSTKGVQFTNSDSRFIIQVPGKLEFDNTHIICCTEDETDQSNGICSMVTLHVQSLPGRPNAVANTTGPDMVLVVVNPSSSGGLPTSYNVTISNSSYVYSNSTPAFLNWSAMVTFTGLTNSTNYTISAVAINCAGSSKPTTIYVSWAAPTPSPSTSSASNPSPTSPATLLTSTQNPIIGAVVGGVVGGVVVIVVIIIIIVLLICLCSSSKTSTKYKIKGKREVSYHNPIAIQHVPVHVPAEESLYDGSTQDQRVPEESLYEGNVPNGRGSNVQEALYAIPDTSKKNTDKMMYADVQVAPAAKNPASGRGGRGVPPPNTSQQQDVLLNR